MAKPISIAIPCHGQASFLGGLLESLGSLAVHEILVCDDGNPRPLEISGERVRLIRNRRREGIARTRNRLLAEATGCLVLFLDADTRLESCSLAELQRSFEDERVIAATGRVVESESPALADRWRARFWFQDHGDRADVIDLAYGLCSIWKRREALDLGGFDPSFMTHAEDVDLSIRALNAGWRLVHQPSLVVRHRRRDSLASLQKMIWRHSTGFSRASRRLHDPRYTRALRRAISWLPICIWSSLTRHRDPALALLSVPSCLNSILARVTVGLTPRARL